MAATLTEMSRCVCIHRDDNVATVLEDCQPGSITILGESQLGSVEVVEAIARGHKIALVPIAAGEPVIKYGVVIGTAGEDIAAGEWVHTHNCRSRFDERSATLDVHSGAPTDTKYE